MPAAAFAPAAELRWLFAADLASTAVNSFIATGYDALTGSASTTR